MHDIKLVRADPAAFDAALARRGVALPSDPLAEPGSSWATWAVNLDQQIRINQTRLQALQAERNEVAKRVGLGKRSGADTSADERRGRAIGIEMTALEAALPGQQQRLRSILSTLPNTLDADIPFGCDESANVVLHTHGAPRNYPFTPRQHFELGEALGMDFATAGKLAGSRFTILRGPLARLERALGQWMLNLHTEQHGYTECAVPLLVNEATMYGTGQLPKFKEDLFETLDGRFLIPTAEVPLTNFVRAEILGESALPMRLAALSQCFRSEAGSAGRDTRGMLRQHQFQKVELVSITTPAQSAAEHERMTACAERVLTELGLTWRRLLLCAGDTGFGAAKTYDLEVWLPGQQAWREISSCSNCRDFQARRMDARFRPTAPQAGAKGTEFLHTLNGSGVAVGRVLIAVMETHQNEDGSITIPEVLRPWMGGLETLALPC